jgi:hypothetical protein
LKTYKIFQEKYKTTTTGTDAVLPSWVVPEGSDIMDDKSLNPAKKQEEIVEDEENPGKDEMIEDDQPPMKKKPKKKDKTYKKKGKGK